MFSRRDSEPEKKQLKEHKKRLKQQLKRLGDDITQQDLSIKEWVYRQNALLRKGLPENDPEVQRLQRYIDREARQMNELLEHFADVKRQIDAIEL